MFQLVEKYKYHNFEICTFHEQDLNDQNDQTD